MENKFLPIGSIVQLKNTNKKVMVIGFLCKEQDKDGELYDYVGCPYPEGMISYDTNLLFNNNQIEKVFKEGYKDNEEIKYENQLESLLNSIKNNKE